MLLASMGVYVSSTLTTLRPGPAVAPVFSLCESLQLCETALRAMVGCERVERERRGVHEHHGCACRDSVCVLSRSLCFSSSHLLQDCVFASWDMVLLGEGARGEVMQLRYYGSVV